MAGNDIVKMDERTRAILLNRASVEIDRGPLWQTSRPNPEAG
jgi:hypothetical protein